MERSERAATVIEMPNERDIVARRSFDAPVGLVFDVLTQPVHMRETVAPFGERVTECSVDLRVGGGYHYVFVTDDGLECSFRGTYLEVEPPNLLVARWRFDGWPDVQALETHELNESDGTTALSWIFSFEDKAGRDRMTGADAIESNLELIDRYLKSIVARR